MGASAKNRSSLVARARTRSRGGPDPATVLRCAYSKAPRFEKRHLSGWGALCRETPGPAHWLRCRPVHDVAQNYRVSGHVKGGFRLAIIETHKFSCVPSAILLGRAMGPRSIEAKHGRARRADAHDAEVGRRVRSRRLENRLSQTELANRIGVTFQQVQKYEKGVNRIGASRLEKIADALDVPVTFFFGAVGNKTSTARKHASVFNLLQTSGSLRLVKAFHEIKTRKLRELLVGLAEQLAEGV